VFPTKRLSSLEVDYRSMAASLICAANLWLAPQRKSHSRHTGGAQGIWRRRCRTAAAEAPFPVFLDRDAEAGQQLLTTLPKVRGKGIRRGETPTT